MKTKILHFCFFIFIFITLTGLNACKKKPASDDQKIDILSDTTGTVPGNPNTVGNNPGGTANNPAYPPKTINISGYIRGAGNANVVLDELTIGGINPLESVIINPDGSFNVSTAISEPGIYRLRFDNGSIHLFLRGGPVVIRGDISNLTKYEVDGSVESVHLRNMYSILDKYNNQTYAIQDRLEILQKDKTRTKELIKMLDSLDLYYGIIAKNKASELQRFITKIDTSMIALLAAFYLPVDDNIDFISKVVKKFSRIAPGSRYYKQLADKIKDIVPIGPGYTAPDMSIKDINGNETALSSLRGKVVLLYFWRSEDVTSRRTNKKLKTIYEKHKRSGFEVYAISLDDDKNKWKTAVTEDGIGWVNVSNLVGPDDEITRLYMTSAIPYMILIDKKGVISAKGITVAELEPKIQSLK